MSSLRTVMACAVASVAAVFGVFWLFNKKKSPPPKKLAEPPDKETPNSHSTETVSDRLLSGDNRSDHKTDNEQNVDADLAQVNLSCGDILANNEKQSEKDDLINVIDDAFKDICEDSELPLEADIRTDEINEKLSGIECAKLTAAEELGESLNKISADTEHTDISNIVQENLVSRQLENNTNPTATSDYNVTERKVEDEFIQKGEVPVQEEASVAVDSLNLEPVSCSETQQCLGSIDQLGSPNVVEELVVTSDIQSLNSKSAGVQKQSEYEEESIVCEQMEATIETQMEAAIESQIIPVNTESETAMSVSTSSLVSQIPQVSDNLLKTINVNDNSLTEESIANSDNKEPISNQQDELETTAHVPDNSVDSSSYNSKTDWAAGHTEANSWVEETALSSNTESDVKTNTWLVNGEVEELNSEPVHQISIDNVISSYERAKTLPSPSKTERTVQKGRWGGSVNSSESSNCDSSSVASSGSSRGGSTPEMVNHRPNDQERTYEFNLPADLCGLFIGTRGKTIKSIRDQSGARIKLRNNPYTPDFQICVIDGSQSAIDKACNIIKRKFPVERYPGIDMTPINASPVLMPEIMQLSLPEGVSVDVVVSSIVDAGRIFVQQPTHPSFPSLDRLNSYMLSCYIQEGSVPDIPRPIENGVICAAPMLNGWYRAQIMAVYEETDECDIKYVDYGGYSRISSQCLKQIRSDFMTLPFEAVECYMANITPLQGESYFTTEAFAVLEELTQGKLLQAQVVGRAEDGIPYIHMYQISGNNSALMVNKEMVNRGVARWIEILS